MEYPDASALVARLQQLPLGTRVSIRRRLDRGFTDALGTLTAVDAEGALIDTRKGDVRISWVDVVAGKPVPPPPTPR